MKIGSFCSGIAAPETAWLPLGWHPQFFSEIDPFASAMLAHRYPEVPNLGNMEAISNEQIRRYAVDLFVAGTPCQSFSVAGLRKGMADPRGNLALIFLRLVDAARPRWVVWENVPGVHSSWSDEAAFAASEESSRAIEEARRACESAGLDLGAAFDAGDFEEVDQTNDFDCFVAGLEELGYGVATRVLNAQYFGVPQRRRRVFVVGYLGDWRPAAAVLLERACLSWNPPPCREAGERVANSVACRPDLGGQGRESNGSDFVIAKSLRAQSNTTHREDSDNYVAVDEFNASIGGVAGTLAGGGRSNRIGSATPRTLSRCVTAGEGARRDFETTTLVTHPLKGEGFDASEDGTGRGVPLIASTVTSNGDANSGFRDEKGLVPVAFTQNQRDEIRLVGGDGQSVGTLPAGQGMKQQAYIAFQERGRDGGRSIEHQSDLAYSLNAPSGGGRRQELNVATPSAVRRLTPRECERLQGFPDDWTLVPYGGGMATDSPRYKAIGNSMAVPVMAWIGRRIEAVEAVLESAGRAA